MKNRTRLILTATLALLLAVGFMPPAEAANNITFSDIKGHWGESFVYSGVDVGYINGYPDGTFRPDETVTRGQFSKMINHALQISNTSSITFTDVSHNAWYFNEVQRAVASGYISGYNDNTFRADLPITRQEAAVIVARVIAPAEVEYSISSLADSRDVATWAEPFVKTVYSKKYMVGDTANNFLPNEPLSRAAAAKIITMMLDNERYISNSDTVSSSGTNYSGTVFTNNLTIGSGVGDGSVTLGNCRVLGTLTTNGGGSNSGVVLRDSAVNNLDAAKSAGNLNIVAVGNTSVNRTTVTRPAHLEESSLTGSGFIYVILSGSNLEEGTVQFTGEFPEVDVQASCVLRGPSGRFKMMRLNRKCNLVIQSGTIDEFYVGSNAKDATVLMNGSVKCSLSNIHAPMRFTGDGKITHAVEHCRDIYYATTPGKVTEYDDGTSKPVSGVETLNPTISPSNGATNVALDRTIRLTFSDSIFRSNGNSMTTGYLKSSVIELRRGSATGDLVDFDVELSSSSKVITITPAGDLAPKTKYFVIVLKDSITNSNRDSNARSAFSFTTEDVYTLSPAVSPANNATKVSRNPSITLTFDEAVYRSNGNDLTTTYVRETVIALREGGYDSVSHIICDVTINSNKKITLKPQVELKADTTYYLIVKEGTLSSANVSSNSQFTTCFSTGSTVNGMISITPDDKATSVSVYTAPILSFGRAVRAYGGNALRASTIENGAIELRKGSKTGTLVSFEASISSNNRTITIYPDDELATNTSYYIIIPAAKLEYTDGEIIPRTEYTFKTGDNTAKFTTFSLVTANKTASSVDVSVTTSLDGKLKLTATPATAGSTAETVEVKNISVTGGSNRVHTIPGLEPNTRYTISGVFSPSNNNADVKSSNLTETTGNVSLTLTVSDPGRETKKATAAVTVDAIGQLTLTYQVKDDDSTLKTPMNQFTPAKTGKIEVELPNLLDGTTYVVKATYVVGGVTKDATEEFTTDQVETNADLSLVRVHLIDGSNRGASLTVSADSAGLYERTISVAELGGATKIKIEGEAVSSRATVKIGTNATNAAAVGSGNLSAEFIIEAGKTFEYAIVVVPESGTANQETYTVKLIVESST